MSSKKKKMMATFSIIAVFVLSAIYLFVPMLGGYNWLVWLLAILNLIAGPAVLVGYIREVRKGIFKDVDEISNKEQ